MTAITTPTLAREQVAADLAGLTGATLQPIILPSSPKSATVGLSPAGMTDTEFLVRVSIYVTTASDVEKAVTTLEALQIQVDALLDHVPRSRWTANWSSQDGAWVASTTVEVGREDM